MDEEHAEEDSWGRDWKDPSPVSGPPHAPTVLNHLRPAQICSRDLLGMYPSSQSGSGAGHAGPASLQTLCTTVLSLFLDQYVEQLGEEGLSWLPVESKALLLAIARWGQQSAAESTPEPCTKSCPPSGDADPSMIPSCWPWPTLPSLRWTCGAAAAC